MLAGGGEEELRDVRSLDRLRLGPTPSKVGHLGPGGPRLTHREGRHYRARGLAVMPSLRRRHEPAGSRCGQRVRSRTVLPGSLLELDTAEFLPDRLPPADRRYHRRRALT